MNEEFIAELLDHISLGWVYVINLQINVYYDFLKKIISGFSRSLLDSDAVPKMN